MFNVILRALVTAGAIAAAALASPLAARADGAWLDRPVAQWNQPWAAIPTAPTKDREFIDPRCSQANARVAAGASERQVQAAGWDLIGETIRGRDVEVVLGTALYDGMCRPVRYQAFAFYAGIFIGTLSPALMDSRTDGALDTVIVTAPATASDGPGLTARFRRYQVSDPLCCPSAVSAAEFRVELVNAGPALIWKQARTGAVDAEAQG